MKLRPTSWLLPVLLLVAACGDRTEAHLEKFLPPGQQPQNLQAAERLDAFALPQDARLADRINTRSFQEVAQLLGAHSYRASVFFSFSSPNGWVSLQETDSIVYARNGDFRVSVENDAGQGFEAIYSSGRFFQRQRYGKFHPRSTLEGQHRQRLEQAYGSWAAAYRLFRGRLGFRQQRLLKYHGRDALRFTIFLAGGKPRLPGTAEPPAVPPGVSKYVYPIEPTPAYQDRWRDHAQPRQAQGWLLVDADQGVVLGVEFRGELQVPAQGERPPLTVLVKLKAQAEGFGNPPALEPPADEQVEPLPGRIKVDTHPLDFYFGKGFTAGLGAPAGVAARRHNNDDGHH